MSSNYTTNLKNKRVISVTGDEHEVFLNNIITNDIKKIETKGKKFDPNLHQAMTEMEDEKVEPGTIVQEMLPGYMFGDRLLRPSLVAVSKKKAQNEVKKPEKSEKK